METIKVGSIQKCAETGKSFVITSDGFTFNYATCSNGDILSDEGVDIREKRELLDRSKPFCCYISTNGQNVTGWKGNILGTITRYNESKNGFNRSTIAYIRVTDIHGGKWFGKGAGAGMFIALRPVKAD